MVGAQFAKCQIDALAARNLSGMPPTLSVENLGGPRYVRRIAMVARSPETLSARALAAAIIIAVGLAVRLPSLAEPLLEGAAGKQTHTAMVARNLYRGRTTWMRPVVDDIGRPGYFVKELPVLPVATAAAYHVLGGVHEWIGRLLPACAWLLAAPLVIEIARRFAGPPVPVLAGFWFVLAPLGVVYSRAFMNDAAAVAVSVGALWLGFLWRERPRPGVAGLLGLAVWLASLLKPHTIFWLAPALAALTLWRPAPARRDAAVFVGAALAAVLLAAPWYLHAWSLHRGYPIPGAMVTDGWVDASLWRNPELYGVVLSQELWMVFTPAGVILAALAWTSRLRPRGAAAAALVAWSLGVVLHCLLLATRMFDEGARRTEYYQLALVPPAAILIALGLAALSERLSRWARARRLVVAGAIVALLISTVSATLEAMAPPARYASLLEDCAAVQYLTTPADEIAVLADRPGTVLYYCDRRGMALVPTSSPDAASPAPHPGSPQERAAQTARLANDLARVRYLYVPFPELLALTPQLEKEIERSWRLVPSAPEDLHLYERRRLPGSTG
jgi:hypothetical protein